MWRGPDPGGVRKGVDGVEMEEPETGKPGRRHDVRPRRLVGPRRHAAGYPHAFPCYPPATPWLPPGPSRAYRTAPGGCYAASSCWSLRCGLRPSPGSLAAARRPAVCVVVRGGKPWRRWGWPKRWPPRAWRVLPTAPNAFAGNARQCRRDLEGVDWRPPGGAQPDRIGSKVNNPAGPVRTPAGPTP